MSHGRLVVDIYKSYKSDGGSSYSSGSGYERVSSKSNHDSSDCYVGYGGAHCSSIDIQKAQNVVSAFDDDKGLLGNQIFALFSVLFGSVKFQCSADNIKGKCDKIGTQIQSFYSENEKNKTQLRKMAGILEHKESKGELKSEGERFVLKYLKEHYSFPGNPDPINYQFSSKDSTGIYYALLNPRPHSVIIPQIPGFIIGAGDKLIKIPEGFIPYNRCQIKLDWSNEFKKYNELLNPQPQYIYKVGGLTFFNEQSAKEYVQATRHARPCDLNRL